MLIHLKNNKYIVIKRKEYTSDKEYYTQIILLKYKTLLNNNISTKQKIVRYVNG